MLYLLLSIGLSVVLLVNFRLFPRFGVDTFQAIVWNYPVCFAVGYLLKDPHEKIILDWSASWTWYCLALGVGFIVTFMLSGRATQRIGITITSLANNISLVIPVLFSLFVFGSATIQFGALNYLGLALGVIAVVIASYKTDPSRPQVWSTKGGGLALGVFLLYGITNTAINYIQMHLLGPTTGAIPFMLVMVLGAAFSGLGVLVYCLLTGEQKFQPKSLLAALTLGVPNFLSFYFLIKSLAHFGSSGAFVYPLYNMGVILVSAFVSWLFFKEKLTRINKAGLGLAILAILLISWNSLFV